MQRIYLSARQSLYDMDSILILANLPLDPTELTRLDFLKPDHSVPAHCYCFPPAVT